MFSSVLEYARGLPTVKSFGQGGASMQSMKEAARENRDRIISFLTAQAAFSCRRAAIHLVPKIHMAEFYPEI